MKSMKRTEFGGCLWFEYGISATNDYYTEYKEKRIEVDCGRSAIQYLIEKNKYKRLWLPVYNCPLVYERIQRTCSIEVVFYNIREDFYPNIDCNKLLKGDVLLWVNYCGVMKDEIIDMVVALVNESEADIIIDNIPAFFAKPRMNVYNIYSCRKFIGVPDGGYIMGKDVVPVELPVYDTSDNYLYLLKALERGSNAVYSDYQIREARINEENIAYGMPVLTRRILKGINYKEIKKIRKNNFDYVHNRIGDLNCLDVNFSSETPSVYPLMIENAGMREYLLSHNVYVSRFWKHVLTNEMANDFEKKMAEYLIPLPIDQRYSEQDMMMIIEIINDAIKKVE